MYQALYRAYRPEVFEEMLGQEHIVRILRNQLETETVSHAYLFCGTRGTGKTTTARILAKGLNCLSDGRKPCGVCPNCMAIREGNFIDVIEMDAASNNGVDSIRELRESVKYPPAVGQKKVYIIDEVHMLSSGAFNALLKTLEEPPEDVVFILATTEPQKLPATILSRCMRLDFRRVPENTLVEGMQRICRDQGIDVHEDALRLIAANADGSVRDGLSILEQCLSAGQKTVSREDVLELLGTSGTEVFLEMTADVLSGKTTDAILLLSQLLADGKDVRQFMQGWLAHYRGLLISKFVNDPENILNMSAENAERLKAQSEKIDLSEINLAIMEISRALADAKWSTQPRVLLELCIVKLSEKGVQRGTAGQRVYSEKQGRSSADPVQTGPKLAQPVPEKVPQPEPKIPGEQQAPQELPEMQKDSPEVTDSRELDTLWHRIFEDGESFKTSFNLIRSGTKLMRLTDKEFVVSASSNLKERYVQENAATLEDLMEKHTGVRRRLRCAGAQETENSKETDLDAVRKMAEKELGIRIEIK